MANEQPRLRVRTLGPTEVDLGGRLVLPADWPSTRIRSIFLLLVASPGHRVAQEQALDLLWPEIEPDAARNALYKAMHGLRRLLEPGLANARQSRFVQTGGGTISLTPGSVSWHDVEQFNRNLETAARAEPGQARVLLRQALELYRGDFAADERYADWPVPRREALRQARHRSTQDLAQLDLDAGAASQSIPLLEALVASEPDAEDIYRALMAAYDSLGQRELALREFERCRQALGEHLGLEPSQETRALADHIRAGQSQILPGKTRYQRAGVFNNLPALPTPTVGRSTETDHLYELVNDSGTRLVTVLGSGGVGKSRLAMEGGAELLPRFPDGVAFVALASIREPARLFDTIARTLNLEPDPRRDMDEVVLGALEHREQLLILDNFEHIIDAAGDVARLLEQCRNVRIVVTSREPLRIRAERVFRLDPLEIPSETNDVSPRVLVHNDAVALLLQSVRAHTPEFALTPANAPTIARLCVRLEGVPLAIEIAAARCLDATPESVLESLDQRLRALREGPRDLPARQRTLRDTIAWSYALLSSSEQQLFRRLGVFVGGVELDALAEVGGPNAPILANVLADKSLANRDLVDGVQRFTMLETIREYALEALVESGESSEIAHGHARFFAELAVRIEPDLMRAGNTALFQRLDRDLSNLRTALSWLVGHQHLPLAIQLAGHLGPFWYARGHAREGLGWLRQVLDADTSGNPEDLALANLWAGRCADSISEHAFVVPHLIEARDLWQAAGNQGWAAAANTIRAIALEGQGHLADAESIFRETLPQLRQAELHWAIALALRGFAQASSYHDDLDSAYLTMESAIGIAEEHAIVEDIQAYLHVYFTALLYESDDDDRILFHADRAEHLSRLIGQPRWSAAASFYRGRVNARHGNLVVAVQQISEAAALFDRCHARRESAMSRAMMARWEMRAGQLPSDLDGLARTVRDLQTAGNINSRFLMLLIGAWLATRIARFDDAMRAVRTIRDRLESKGLTIIPEDGREIEMIEHEANSALAHTGQAAETLQQGDLEEDSVFAFVLDLVMDARQVRS